jgi:hypothetical protein
MKTDKENLQVAVDLLTEWRDTDISEDDDQWADFTNRVYAFLSSLGKSQPKKPSPPECNCPRNNMYDSSRTGWREDCPEHGLKKFKEAPATYQGSPAPMTFTPKEGERVWVTLDGQRVQATVYGVYPGKGVTLTMDDRGHVIVDEGCKLEPVIFFTPRPGARVWTCFRNKRVQATVSYVNGSGSVVVQLDDGTRHKVGGECLEPVAVRDITWPEK